MSLVKVTWTKGDTLTPLGAQLKRISATGTYEAVDLTSYTVKFKMVSESGAEIVAETASGVTVADASEGKVYFDFSAAHVANVGVFYAWFLIYSGAERDTFPYEGRTFQITIKGAA